MCVVFFIFRKIIYFYFYFYIKLNKRDCCFRQEKSSSENIFIRNSTETTKIKFDLQMNTIVN